MLVTIASPDKISISMFLSFMRFCLGKDYGIGTTHSLMTKTELETYVNNLLSSADKFLFSYYAKKGINIDPLKIVPEKLISISNMVIWINLYSIDWFVLKDDSNQAPYYIDRWKKNMDKLNLDPVGL